MTPFPRGKRRLQIHKSIHCTTIKICCYCRMPNDTALCSVWSMQWVVCHGWSATKHQRVFSCIQEQLAHTVEQSLCMRRAESVYAWPERLTRCPHQRTVTERQQLPPGNWCGNTRGSYYAIAQPCDLRNKDWVWLFCSKGSVVCLSRATTNSVSLDWWQWWDTFLASMLWGAMKQPFQWVSHKNKSKVWFHNYQIQKPKCTHNSVCNVLFLQANQHEVFFNWVGLSVRSHRSTQSWWNQQSVAWCVKPVSVLLNCIRLKMMMDRLYIFFWKEQERVVPILLSREESTLSSVVQVRAVRKNKEQNMLSVLSRVLWYREQHWICELLTLHTFWSAKAKPKVVQINRLKPFEGPVECDWLFKQPKKSPQKCSVQQKGDVANPEPSAEGPRNTRPHRTRKMPAWAMDYKSWTLWVDFLTFFLCHGMRSCQLLRRGQCEGTSTTSAGQLVWQLLAVRIMRLHNPVTWEIKIGFGVRRIQSCVCLEQLQTRFR